MPAPSADVPEDLCRRLLARVPSMLAYFDRGLRCRFANEAYARAFGMSTSDLLGLPLVELLGEAEWANRRVHIEAALSGRPQRLERRTPTGRRLLIHYAPDEVAAGDVRGVLVEVTDITDALRPMEDAVAEGEARFRMLSEFSPLGVFATDGAGNRTYLNARWQEIYGLPASLGLGDGWQRAVHEDDRARVADAWRRMAREGTEVALEFRIRRANDGSLRHLRARTRPLRDADGAISGFVGVLEDDTDRLEQEERLRASESFLERTGAVARIGAWEVDLRTRQLTWSAQMRRLCEVPDDHVPVFMGGQQFYPPAVWEGLQATIEAAISSGRGWDLELPFITARGRELWVRVWGEVEMEDGVATRLLGALQDVTEQRRTRLGFAQETVRREASERHAAELDRLLGERNEMLDVLAHEVRQPLNNASAALQGAASVLHEIRAGEAAGRLLRAQGVLGQVVASIDNTLAVASLLARPDPVQMVDTDIDTLLQVAIADMPPDVRPRVRIERDTDARTVAIDLSLMRLALRNLLANALRFSPEGSPVVLRVGESEAPLGVLIDVVNDGGPIPAATMLRLFERGHRRSAEHAVPAQGLGLGLYIVRRVMELHGGSVALLGNDGRQVSFRLVLGPGPD